MLSAQIAQIEYMDKSRHVSTFKENDDVQEYQVQHTHKVCT